jgi:hypothetical protein
MIFVTMERTPLSSITSRWLGDFTFFQYNRSLAYLASIPGSKTGHEESITCSCNRARGRFFARPQTNGGQAKKSQLDGTWELVAGQQLPKGAREIKIISGGHFIFAAYDTGKGELLGTGGGTYVLNGSSYTEHVDFGDRISPGVVGKDQQFAVKIDGDTFVQAGTLSNGKNLSETWKRVK